MTVFSFFFSATALPLAGAPDAAPFFSASFWSVVFDDGAGGGKPSSVIGAAAARAALCLASFSARSLALRAFSSSATAAGARCEVRCEVRWLLWAPFRAALRRLLRPDGRDEALGVGAPGGGGGGSAPDMAP